MVTHGETYVTLVPSLGSPSWCNYLHRCGVPSPLGAKGQVVSPPRASMRATVGVHRLTSQPSAASGLCATTVAHVSNHLHRGGAPSPPTATGRTVSPPRAPMRATVGVHRLTSQPSAASGLCATTVAHVGSHLHRGGAPSPPTARGQVVSPRASMRAPVGVHRLTSQPSAASGLRVSHDDGRDCAEALGAKASGADVGALPPELLGGATASACMSARAGEPTPRDESQGRSCTSKRRSADVKVSGGGSDLQLRVRILPAELFKWTELQICACIDKASFGEVMLARHGNEMLSLKRCHVGADNSMTKEQLHNFEREINAYRILKHPGVVGYVGCVLDPPNLAILTEYMPRGNVFNLLYMNEVNLPAAIRLRISRQLTELVDFMHGLDPVLVHLDLKTPNILLDNEYNAKLCDFGKTQALDIGSSVVPGSELLGSPRYMAPELLNGLGSPFTEKADIWGLACCLIEILGGPIPFEDVPEESQIVDCLRRRVPPLVPHWFAEAVKLDLKQCFFFKPELRPTAAELTVALWALTPHDMERRGMDRRRAS